MSPWIAGCGNRISRGLGRLRRVAGDRGAQLLIAVGLALAVLVWLAIRALRAAPIILVFLPTIAFVLACIAVAFLVLGGIGWLIVRLLRLVVLWRAGEQLRNDMTKTQQACVIASVVFLGLPELWHAGGWWQEHLLHWIPGEEEAFAQIGEFLHDNAASVFGLAFMAAVGCTILWNAFSHFRERLRHTLAVTRSLFSQRDWRFPLAVGATAIGTAVLLARFDNEAVAEVLAGEIIILWIWLFLPLIIPNLAWIVIGAAWFVPAMVMAERLDGGAHSYTYWGIALVWGVWLGSILANAMPRALYWAGVLGFLGYLAW